MRIPAGIKEDKYRTNVMTRSYIQKRIDSLLEPSRVLLPEEVVQKYAHRVHAKSLGPTQFFVDLLRIESVRLPHFKFVDCVCRYEVATNQPRLVLVPLIGFGFVPT